MIEKPYSSRDFNNTSPVKKNLLHILFLTIVLFAPLPFGSNHQTSWYALICFSGLLMFFWSVLAATKHDVYPVHPKHIWFPLLCTTLVYIWAYIQTLELSWLPSHPIWTTINQEFQFTTPNSLSLAPITSQQELLRALAYSAFFWIAFQLYRSHNYAKQCFHIFIYASALYAIYGIYLDFTGSKNILWLEKKAYMNSLTSTFINRNNYATYAGMGLIVTFGLLIEKLFKNLPRATSVKEVLISITKRLFTHGFFYINILVILTVALILTHSRAGLFSTVIGTLALFIIATATYQLKPYRKIFLSIIALTSILLSFILFQGGRDTFGRFEKMENPISMRSSIYTITLDAIKDNSLYGTGLGTYPGVFESYRNNSYPAVNARNDHAHNTYLELMLELGIPAFIIIMLGFIFCFFLCIKGALTRKRGYIYPCISFAVTIQVATHALFDFSLEIPAIFITYLVILAVGTSQTWSLKKRLSS